MSVFLVYTKLETVSKIINESNRQGVEISLKSVIIDVTGFPFKAFIGDNVNQIIDANIHINH